MLATTLRKYTPTLKKRSLDATVRHLLAHAAAQPSGRSAETVYGGHEHVLRQTVIALLQGQSLGDHENPGEATVYVLHGRVRVSNQDTQWDAITGDLLALPPVRHRLDAVTDAAILLTVAKT